MAPGAAASILHADLDAFYASVEQLLDPSLRGKPIAVGGGVVLAASYEARAFGVHGGMSGWRARQLCPGLLFVGGHFKEYQRLGDEVIDVLHDFTPYVERISIDEAFLDVTGSIHLFGPPRAIADKIRERVRREIGLPVSVGAANTKHLAKVASQVAKPDGVVVVEPGTEEVFLAPLPIELIWGVGPVTRRRLHEAGIKTIGELAATSPSSLQQLLGRAIGHKLGTLAANDDPRWLDPRRRAGSVGAQSALGRRRATPETLRASLGHVADRVGSRLRAAHRSGHTITVRVRFGDMRAVTRSITLRTPVAATTLLRDVGVTLAQQALADHPEEREITLVAIAVSNLVDDAALQLELPFPDLEDDVCNAATQSASARWSVDKAVDVVRARFGRAAVGYAGVALGDVGGVPDEFRELAEADQRQRRGRKRGEGGDGARNDERDCTAEGSLPTSSTMSRLRDRLEADLKQAMRERDRTKVSVLRTTISALSNAEAVDASGSRAQRGAFANEAVRRELTDADIEEILQQERAELLASIDEYVDGGEQEAAEALRAKAAILESYLSAS